MVNWILFLSSLLGVLAAIFIFYSNLGIIYDRNKGKLYGLSKEKPEDIITRRDLFRATFKKNRAAFVGFSFLLLAFSLQLVEGFNLDMHDIHILDDVMPTCCISISRWLSLLGIFLSSLGTAGMIYGGLDHFIGVTKTEDGQYTMRTGPVASDPEQAKKTPEMARAREENIKEGKDIERHLKCYKYSMWLLFIGFIIQMAAIMLNS